MCLFLVIAQVLRGLGGQQLVSKDVLYWQSCHLNQLPLFEEKEEKKNKLRKIHLNTSKVCGWAEVFIVLGKGLNYFMYKFLRRKNAETQRHGKVHVAHKRRVSIA